MTSVSPKSFDHVRAALSPLRELVGEPILALPPANVFIVETDGKLVPNWLCGAVVTDKQSRLDYEPVYGPIYVCLHRCDEKHSPQLALVILAHRFISPVVISLSSVLSVGPNCVLVASGRSVHPALQSKKFALQFQASEFVGGVDGAEILCDFVRRTAKATTVNAAHQAAAAAAEAAKLPPL